MDARLQRRVQRYGWDLAAARYEPLWGDQVGPAHERLLECAALVAGERVLDIACGTGLVSFAAARAVAPGGELVGVDLSGRMVELACRRADVRRVGNVRFRRMDAERLDLPEAHFDVVLCSLGLMYMPDPVGALREMRRVLRPGGRLAVAVWGEASRCGWSSIFPIVDAEVRSEVCPLFFRLGRALELASACAVAQFGAVQSHRIPVTMAYADGESACEAAFAGGPVALAWSRFDGDTRLRVRERFLASIAPFRHGKGYRIPAEFVVANAVASGPQSFLSSSPTTSQEKTP